MTAAIFALIGTALGILGTLTVELVRARTVNVSSRREALRLACADFTASVARMRALAMESIHNRPDADLMSLMHEAHREARIHYERLRLTAVSQDVQEAGRYVLRYAYGLLRQMEGKPPRDDEREHGPIKMLHNSLITLYAAARRETGVPHADDVYREPDEWLGNPGPKPTPPISPSPS